MNLSLSKRSSVECSERYSVLSIDHPSPAPDGIEATSPNTKEGACGSLFKYIVPLLSFIYSEMEEIWFPFVVHAIASPVLCIWGCVTLHIKLLVLAASVIPHLIMCLIWTISWPITLCGRMIRKKLPPSPVFEKITRKLPPLSVLRKKIRFAISCIAVSLDPLFFYIPTIDEKNKCLDMDRTLMIVVLVLRSFTDLVFIYQIATRVRVLIDEFMQMEDVDDDHAFPKIFDQSLRAKFRLRDLVQHALYESLLNLLVILPVQQVAIIIGFFRLGSSGYKHTTTAVNIFLVLHLILRAYHIYFFHKHLKIFREWANAALNFFLYILAAHVLGAFWYFFSIQRKTSCWHQVCKNTAGCITTYYCKDTPTSPNATVLDEFCAISSKSTTGHAHESNFGIYLDAFQYGITGSINFSTKFFYTFWWGLRNLSNFGTNLETSSQVWENLFTILIAIIGWLLFLYLIGNAQTYILSASHKQTKDEKRKILKTHEAIKSWMSKHLSSNEFLQMHIIRAIREGKIVERKNDRNMDVDVDMEFFFSCLTTFSEETQVVKLVLCQRVLNKVVWRTPSPLQRVVIDKLEPVVYKKNERVVKRNERIDIILIIVDGVIVVQGPNAGAGSRYEKGDILGEHIFFLHDDQSPLLSTGDYRCETKVEAFALTYKKWRRMVSDIHKSEKEEKAAVVYSKSDDSYLNKVYRKLTTTRWGDIEREIGLKMKLKRDGIEGLELEKTKISIKEIDILDWLSRNGFSNDARGNIMTHIKGIVNQTIDHDVDIKYILSNVPWDIQKSIRKNLGMKSLTKVPMLQNMDASLLSIMCEEYLQPEIYSENNHLVVRAGETIGLMFIIIEGTIIAGSSRLLKKGDFYGEPLLNWASPNNLFSGPAPISSEDVICRTKVEVLELKANKFRRLVDDFSSQWISNFNMCGDSQQLDEDLAFPCDKINKKLNELDELAFRYDKIDKKLNETYKQLESKEGSQIEAEDEELRKIKIMLKENKILDWVSNLGISKDIMTQIKRSIKIRNVVEEKIDADVNLEYVLSIFPPNIKQSLKEHICINSLKKVPILENVDEDVLNRICLNLEPVILPQDSYVIKAGEELNRMIIVVKGEVTRTTTSNESTQATEYYLEKGHLFGDEILASAFPYIFSLPTSKQNIMCQTKVEALVLTLDGLQNVVSYYKCKVYHADKQLEELTSTSPLGLQGGITVADTNLSSSSTSLDQRLDQILQLQVSARDQLANQGRKIDEMAEFLAKFGYGGKPPPVT